jgi:superfamily II DNA or RNA helicase
MDGNPFQTRAPSIEGNPLLRVPQTEAYGKLVEFAQTGAEDREGGIVLPVGCGKSGCITIAPFAFKAKRTLVVAPGLNITTQLQEDFDPASPKMFYAKCKVIDGPPYPEPVEIRGTTTNRADLDEADVVITNIQQLQGESNRWLDMLEHDYFDLILFDEGHHSVAATWDNLKKKFPGAKIVNFSATPLRADGQKMAGRILYSFSIVRAIKEGYVKRLKAIVLNPATLRYVRRVDGREVEVDLGEVRRLGEDDADFRRSIVTSAETLNTIVDASIRELQRIRTDSGDSHHKIIASALNYEHCRQIVEAYRARGQRADYVHSKEDGAANRRIIDKLHAHDLDVIVQVRKLGEGFDHPYLSVAAVFSIFANLSPFVQFVGRIMRVVVQNNSGHPNNQGTVAFHAGGNVARQWEDFQEYSDADQKFFDELLPMEELNFASSNELVIQPGAPRTDADSIDVQQQTNVTMEEIPLVKDDPVVAKALEVLKERGISPEEYKRAVLAPVPTTKARKRQAARSSLDMRVRNEVGRVLGERGLNPVGKELDTKHIGQTNFVVVKAAIDKQVNKSVNRKGNERSEMTAPELAQIDQNFEALVTEAVKEVFGGA